MSGRCRTSEDGRLTGSSSGRCSAVERECRNLRFGGRLAHEHGKLVVDHIQRCSTAEELAASAPPACAGCEHRNPRRLRHDNALPRSSSSRCSIAISCRVRVDLLAQLGLVDGRGDHIPCQHEARAFKLPRPRNRAAACRPSIERRLAPKISSAYDTATDPFSSVKGEGLGNGMPYADRFSCSSSTDALPVTVGISSLRYARSTPPALLSDAPWIPPESDYWPGPAPSCC